MFLKHVFSWGKLYTRAQNSILAHTVISTFSLASRFPVSPSQLIVRLMCRLHDVKMIWKGRCMIFLRGITCGNADILNRLILENSRFMSPQVFVVHFNGQLKRKI